MPRLAFLATAVLTGVLALSPLVAPASEPQRGRLALAAAGLLILLALVRVAVYGVARRLRRRRRVAHPVIVVGTGSVGRRLTEALLRQPAYGLRPVGMISVESAAAEADRLPSLYLGDLDALHLAMVDLGVRDVVFAFSSAPEEPLVRAIRRSVASGHQVFVVPRFFDIMGRQHFARTEIVHGIALTRLDRISELSVSRSMKRLLDSVLSTLGLIVLLPMMIVIGLLVRRETGGVFYRQVRVGRLGRTFSLYKFQSLKPSPKEGESWNIDNDARLGPVGRFVRRTGLDELPQLFNVLRGDMSLVGPRPERPHFVAEFSRRHSGYVDRHRVRAGITGWAQVHDLRGDTSISERVRFDNNYIDDWSLWRDITILAQTLPTLRRPQPTGTLSTTIFSDAPRVAAGKVSTAPSLR